MLLKLHYLTYHIKTTWQKKLQFRNSSQLEWTYSFLGQSLLCQFVVLFLQADIVRLLQWFIQAFELFFEQRHKLQKFYFSIYAQTIFTVNVKIFPLSLFSALSSCSKIVFNFSMAIWGRLMSEKPIIFINEENIINITEFCE